MSHIKPAINCKDGTTLSVQASKYHYCSPRADGLGAWQQYTLVEVGFITKGGEPVTPPDSWREYSSDCEFPSDVYAYIPTDLVGAFIKEHGGAEL